MPQPNHLKGNDATLNRLERRLQEAYEELWSSFIDPRDAMFDVDGLPWLPVGFDADVGAPFGWGPTSDTQLREIRNQCRLLALGNEFAINGHENRISFIVGAGHTYSAAAKKGQQVPAAWVAAVQAVLDEFIQANNWQRRQQEIVLRRDRDGEVFLRFFVSADGATRVRFVEPGQVATPPDQAANPAARLGVLTDPDDVETVLAYYVDGQAIDADQIQHRKANVDANVRRGLPLYFAVRKNLRRAEKLLRNMSVVAEIQSAIALIRKHHRSNRGAVEQFVAASADVNVTNSVTGQSANFRRYGPGTILDAQADVDYDFPAAGIDAANFVAILQAELRAIAARLVMPEFMLSSDASNANYSSTMIAEGPAMRMFQRLQAEQVADDLQVMWRVVLNAVVAGRLPSEVQTAIDIAGVAPTLAVRDQLQETQRFQIENAAGILSPQTWSQRLGLDYGQEQANLAAHAARRRENQKPIEIDAAALPLDASASNALGVAQFGA
ncbi:MAG TPA: phage portal protein [Pirellulales bacterium]|nr:phage portal protein [Pirellulales bacterium]